MIKQNSQVTLQGALLVIV